MGRFSLDVNTSESKKNMSQLVVLFHRLYY